MPAGRVVILGDLVQTELPVEIRTDKFRSIDHAAFQRRENFTRWDKPRVDAQFLVDAAGKPGDTHLHALQVFRLFDGLPEPACHLHAGIAADKRHKIEAIINLAPQVETAAIEHPAVESLEVQTE